MIYDPNLVLIQSDVTYIFIYLPNPLNLCEDADVQPVLTRRLTDILSISLQSPDYFGWEQERLTHGEVSHLITLVFIF